MPNIVFFSLVNFLLLFLYGIEAERIEDFQEYINKNVDPCDDFYEYTCGNFNQLHPLQPNVSIVDQFTILQGKILKLTNEILSSPDDKDDPQALKRARAVYQACISVDYMDNFLFKDPEKRIVEQMQGYPIVEPTYLKKAHKFGWNDVADAVSKYGLHMLFTITILPSYVNASKNLIYIEHDAGVNPQLNVRAETEMNDHEVLMERSLSDMVLERGHRNNNESFSSTTKQRGGTTMKPFDIYLRKLALKIQKAMGLWPDERTVDENIEEMANFMRGVFTEGYIPPGTNITQFNTSSVTLADLNDWTRNHFGDSTDIEWVEYMRRIFRNSGINIDQNSEVVVTTKLANLLYGILNIVKITSDDIVKSFVMTRIFLYNSPDSDREARDMLEEYYRAIKVVVPSRWEYCTKKVTDLEVNSAIGLSLAVTYEYQLHHFNVNRLKRASQMVLDLKASFKDLIKESTWMDDGSKVKALKKLDKMITILGYPDWVDNVTLIDEFYENFRVCKWDNYGNTLNLRAFKMAYQYSQVLKRDRESWSSSPFRINAFYNKPNNRITFPVAILNPIFFGADSSILDYGRIGSIIGHEITHGFDLSGSTYNEDGLLVQTWWTKDTSMAFKNRTQCFVDQYSQYYIPEIDSKVNATSTLNENIADNGGMRESFRAFQTLLNRLDPKTKNNHYNYTDNQLFFIGFASMWCNNPSKSYLLEQINQEHAPSKWRVNGVLSNMDEFSKAFQCPIGSRMNPEKKCIIF